MGLPMIWIQSPRSQHLARKLNVALGQAEAPQADRERLAHLLIYADVVATERHGEQAHGLAFINEGLNE